MKKILVPVDGSTGSEKAVQVAISLTTEKDDQLILLNVQPSYNTPNVKRFFSQEQIRAFQEESSKEVFEQTLDLIGEAELNVSSVVRNGDAGSEICEQAKELSVDFIVMGYRGLGTVKRAILGSVSTHVLHEADCPVMIVP